MIGHTGNSIVWVDRNGEVLETMDGSVSSAPQLIVVQNRIAEVEQ